jgi:hypothetical protein
MLIVDIRSSFAILIFCKIWNVRDYFSEGGSCNSFDCHSRFWIWNNSDMRKILMIIEQLNQISWMRIVWHLLIEMDYSKTKYNMF